VIIEIIKLILDLLINRLNFAQKYKIKDYILLSAEGSFIFVNDN